MAISLRSYWSDFKRSFVGGGTATYGGLFVDFDSTYKAEELGSYLETSNAIYVCARYRAQLLSSLPIQLHKISKSGKKTLVTSGRLYELLQKVNPFWTSGRLIEMSEMSLSVWGQCFWVIQQGSRDKPEGEIWWMNPKHMKVVRSNTDYIAGFVYQVPESAEVIHFKREEIVWLRYPNPNDQFSGLPPIAAARIAADIARYAETSNVNIFKNGMQISGLVSPAGDNIWTENQVKQIEEGMRKKFGGANNAHRLGVLNLKAAYQAMSLTPADAEYLGALEWSFEEVCRALGVPTDLVMGKSTFNNVHDARVAIWTDTMLPETRFIGAELTEQLLPLFPGEADLISFDTSGVSVLQELEDAKWQRWADQLKVGAKVINQYCESVGDDPKPWGDVWWAPAAGGGVVPITSAAPPISPTQQLDKGGLTVNEVRESQGLKSVPWGDVWWAPPGLVPVSTAEQAEPPEPPPLPDPSLTVRPPEDPKALPPGEPRRRTRSVAFGSDEHERAWTALVRRMDPHEQAVGDTTAKLMRNQKKSILARLNNQRGRATRDVADVANDPFDKAKWIKAFRQGIRPVFTSIVDDIGTAAMDELGIGIAFDVKSPEAIRFLVQRSQRFAEQVNETTWNALQGSLSEGIDAGEGIDELARRVEQVMGDRIRSSAENIARTETIGALNGGTQLAWEQSDVVTGKEWLSALDERTRQTHSEAHGQRRRLSEDFNVGGGSGPHPGAIGLASEDCQCRCSMTAILDVDWVDE